MHNYLVTVNMQDGSQCRYKAPYANDFDAIDAALSHFPEALTVCPRRLS